MKKIGVIIGRFMCPSLHEGHINFIQKVIDLSDEVICFLGTSVTKTRKNPLNFETRELMIKSEFPTIKYILPVKDNRSDELWSSILDETILNLYFNQDIKIILFGSRDSFIPHYTGQFETKELKEIELNEISATHVRKTISESPIDSSDFRRGIIYGQYQQYPHTYFTTDCAILNDDSTQVLLGRKPTECKFRFIGGFVDDGDTLEANCHRECIEEVGKIELDQFIYLSSRRIDDFRYRGSGDSIMTAFFKCKYIYGHPVASDDIQEIGWFKLDEFTNDDIMEEHVILLEDLKNHLNKEKAN